MLRKRRSEASEALAATGKPYPPDPHHPAHGLPPYIDLTEAYVPIQPYGEMFNPLEALTKGSLFVDLYRPYAGYKGGKY